MKEYEKYVPCPQGFSCVYRGAEESVQRHGEAYELHLFEVVDATGNVAKAYEVCDAAGIYPPFNRSVSVQETLTRVQRG
ncbi:MAG: hypothetical protein JWR68_175 [Polaromonas sp.]|nr:hypothetical protein [Polaromonas sp.]